MEKNSIQHHGIRGMKWGIRRTETQLAGSRGDSSKAADHEDYSRAHSPASAKSMSDKELRDRINRLQMERQYAQLNATKVSVGRKFVQEVLVNAAKQTAASYVSKGMGKGVDLAINALIKKK